MNIKERVLAGKIVKHLYDKPVLAKELGIEFNLILGKRDEERMLVKKGENRYEKCN